jgi:hypothetical protein
LPECYPASSSEAAASCSRTSTESQSASRANGSHEAPGFTSSGSRHTERSHDFWSDSVYLARTEPFLGPKADPPPPLDDEEWATVSGLAAISPSEDVLAALEDATEKAGDFESEAFILRRIKARPSAARVNEDPHEEPKARRAMDAARGEALNAISEVQRKMREELAEL